jgi:hypothetical protein
VVLQDALRRLSEKYTLVLDCSFVGRYRRFFELLIYFRPLYKVSTRYGDLISNGKCTITPCAANLV